MSNEYPTVLDVPTWSEGYLRELGYADGEADEDLAKVTARLRKIAGSEPITKQNCYRVVPRAELHLLADVIEQWAAKRPWLERGAPSYPPSSSPTSPQP